MNICFTILILNLIYKNNFYLMTKIFFITGEKSGDLLGSKIIKAFKQNSNGNYEFVGLGGELMSKEGFESFFNIKELAVMGIFEVAKNLINILKRIDETVNYILQEKPAIIITIDSPDFSFRVMKKIKQLDIDNKIKKVHLIAPSVWVHRKNRAQKIAKIYDLLLCILPFEPPYFEKYGLKTVFIGHPIFDKASIEYEFNQENFVNNYDVNSNIISFMCGSRKSEINNLLPAIMQSITLINNKYENFTFKLLVTGDTKPLIIDYLNKMDEQIIAKIEIIDENKKYEIIKKSKLVIAKSGTNLLEISAFNIPMIIIYKFNFLTNLVAIFLQWKNKVKYVGLPNILANKSVIPELLLFKCNAENIFNKFDELINNDELLLQQIKENKNNINILKLPNNQASADKIIQEILGF